MNQREASRRDWRTNSVTGASIEEINSGSLQRIADATEKMAASYDALRNERDRLQRWYDTAKAEWQLLARRNAALRGVITRMKTKRSK